MYPRWRRNLTSINGKGSESVTALMGETLRELEERKKIAIEEKNEMREKESKWRTRERERERNKMGT